MITPSSLKFYVYPPSSAQSTTNITQIPTAELTDVSDIMVQTGWQIQTQYSRQSDTAIFYFEVEVPYDPVSDSYGNYTLPILPLSQYMFYNVTTSTVIAAGLVVNVLTYYEYPNLLKFEVETQGWQSYLAKAVTVSTWSGMTAGQILLAVLQPNASGQTPYGIIAKSINNGGYVYDDYGPTYAAGSANNPHQGLVQFNGVALQDVTTQLQKLASVSTVWGCYVDSNANLHFGPAETENATTVILTASLTSEGSTIYAAPKRDGQLYYEYDATDMRNNIILTGSQISVRRSEEFIVGVAGPPWQLLFTPDQNAGESSISVSTPSQVYQEAVLGYSVPVIATVGPYANPPESEFQFYTDSTGSYLGLGTLNQSGSVIPGELTGNQLSLGSTVRFSYTYPSVVLGTVQAPYMSDNPYVGPNNGVWSEIINDSSIGNLSSIQNRGLREIVEYGYPSETLTCTLSEAFTGHIRAGDVITVQLSFIPDSQNNYILGLSDNFIVTSCTMQASQAGAGYFTYNITAMRLFTL